ncbi:hypothetical protein E2C01_044092 [Portunus trituberculatus]|uniref:Uncharacterized protein n=1 Tax=Portunus trituberculatus TaxID=210409 RepID=A0A5B7FYG8_PORTR|nr:hypothetical protein [Portunus trituberculatus]
MGKSWSGADRRLPSHLLTIPPLLSSPTTTTTSTYHSIVTTPRTDSHGEANACHEDALYRWNSTAIHKHPEYKRSCAPMSELPQLIHCQVMQSYASTCPGLSAPPRTLAGQTLQHSAPRSNHNFTGKR